MANNKSHAKTIRSQKRLIKFLKFKTIISPLGKRSFISISPQSTVQIPPQQPKLTAVKLAEINIKPKKIYHPTVINACDSIFKKHPDNLSNEEIQKFNKYRSWKSEMGDPLEANPVYLPIGGLRKCLVC